MSGMGLSWGTPAGGSVLYQGARRHAHWATTPVAAQPVQPGIALTTPEGNLRL